MISLYPSFYDKFLCKAGDCLHSCCIQNWDIDIDDGTAEKYKQTDGPLGDELRNAMISGSDGFRFIMTEEGCCPFFDDNGLCRIVLEKGDDYLCDICAMHPRFFVYVSDFELSGVGLSCEKSVELLLSEEGPLSFTTEKGNDFFDLPAILEALDFSPTAEEIIFTPRIDKKYYENLLSFLKKTEAIDEAWTSRLASLVKDLPFAEEKVTAFPKNPSALSRVYQYILYRGLEKSEHYGIPAVMEYARQSTDFILLEAALYGDFPENIRRWSEQIEYDTENTDLWLRRVSSL